MLWVDLTTIYCVFEAVNRYGRHIPMSVAEQAYSDSAAAARLVGIKDRPDTYREAKQYILDKSRRSMALGPLRTANPNDLSASLHARSRCSPRAGVYRSCATTLSTDFSRRKTSPRPPTLQKPPTQIQMQPRSSVPLLDQLPCSQNVCQDTTSASEPDPRPRRVIQTSLTGRSAAW
jgi:hypothetical protein